MKRVELVAALKRVEPALATHELIPVFTCFRFDGKTVVAYDDVVGLRVACAFPFQGGVAGRVLVDFLSAARGKDLSVTTTKAGENDGDHSTNFELKVGRAKLKVPVVPLEDFLFKFPATKGADEVEVDEEFVAALERASSSMGKDPVHPWRFGVTVRFQNDSVLFYSTDNVSAGKVVMPYKGLGGVRSTILPPRFVELLVKSMADDTVDHLYLGKGWAQADFRSGMRLMSRTVDQVEVKAYEKLFSSVDDAAKDIEVPNGFENALNRALVVLGHLKDEEKAMIMTVKEGKLRLNALSAIGEVNDLLRVPGHPDVTITASPEQLKKALPYVNHFRIFNGCVRFRAPTFTHLVAGFVK